MSEDEPIAESLARVRARLAAACERAGRDLSEVELVAVSKTVAVERVREAMVAGIAALGENRVQEAEAKVPRLPDAEWHLVGHLQSNKAAKALALFDVIQSVDSLALAQRVDRLLGEGAVSRREGPYPVYLQVNVDADPAKEGFGVDELVAAMPALAALPRLELRGLMTVGRVARGPDDARPTFRRLEDVSRRLRG